MASKRSSSDSNPNERWEVFLSFRGKDTRRAFVSHLFSCLEEKGFNVFMDHKLRTGLDISLQLMDTIRSSRISVVVFSRNYAQSRWCLRELLEIMECSKKSPPQLVFPVFYDASPSDVRRQMGCFGKAFARNRKDKDAARWKTALAEAGSLSGWDITDPANGPEAEIIKKITGKISDELNNTYLHVAKHPVGLEFRMIMLNQDLNVGSDDVRFIVIWGMGGIGKTTLAKAAYNKIFRTFEATSFLADIDEKSKHHEGLVRLQEQLLYDILKYEQKIGNKHRGIKVIEQRMRSRRVLIVLDNISHREQLEALAGGVRWFGPGSRIIITTRDLESVKEIKSEYVYSHQVGTLNDAESLQLFKCYAFQNCDGPGEELTQLSQDVIGICGGLPLALEVLGSFLLDRSVEDWESAIEQLRQSPHDDILKKLEISYQTLGSDNEKNLFLDIACFFVGWDKDLVLKILEACRIRVELGLGILTRRSLVKVSSGNQLEMHDVIRDMGRELVRRESRNPGKRSRLFSDEDILETLESNLGTETVEGLVLHSSNLLENVNTNSFAEMKRLRLLQLDNLHLEGDYGLISKNLRWLHWDGFPLKFLPDELYMEKLVVINICYSKLQVAWRTSKLLRHLKVLNLGHSHFLAKTPEFSRLPNLEQLIMEDCIELRGVDPSVGCLERLVLVNLKDCKKLESIPPSISRVKSLRVLDISGCSRIKRLPEDFGELDSLTEFLADGTLLEQLPESITELKNLSKLSLHGYKRSTVSSVSAFIWSWISRVKPAAIESSQLTSGSFSGLKLLTELDLIDCNLSGEIILEGIGSLQSLSILNLTRSVFRHLPDSISCLSNLRGVTVAGCPELESLPDMPPSVNTLQASDCPSLKRVSLSGFQNAEVMEFMNCVKLEEISSPIRWNPYVHLLLDGCKNLSPNSFLKDWRGNLLTMPGSDIPDRFEYKTRGPSLSLRLPPCHVCELNRINVSYVIGKSNHESRMFCPWLIITYKSRNSSINLHPFSEDSYIPDEDHICICSVSPREIAERKPYAKGPFSLSRGIVVALEAESHVDWIVKGIGIELDVQRCPNCSLVIVDDSGVGPSNRGYSESPPENELTSDTSTEEKFLLRFTFC